MRLIQRAQVSAHQVVSPGLEAAHVIQGERAATAAVVGRLNAHQGRPGAVLVIRPIHMHTQQSASPNVMPE